MGRKRAGKESDNGPQSQAADEKVGSIIPGLLDYGMTVRLVLHFHLCMCVYQIFCMCASLLMRQIAFASMK